jgi:hypothetical protein
MSSISSLPRLRILKLLAASVACCALLAAATGAPGQQAAPSHLAAPVALQTEGKANPLAIAGPAPRLSWTLSATNVLLHSVRQSAYQVEVAARPQDLAATRNLVWNSGKTTASAEAVPAASYNGQPLEPAHTYWWSVRVWDENGQPSLWSSPAHWTQAPLWHTQWIAAQATDSEAGVLPMPLLRTGFHLPADVRSAVLHISGLGQYEVHLNGNEVGSGELAPGWSDYRKTVFYDSYDVTGQLHSGDNAIGVLLGNGMYRVRHTQGRYTKFTGSFGPPQCIAQLHVELANGKSFDLATGSDWKTAPGPIVFSSTYGGEDYDARRELPGWDRAAFNDAHWTQVVVTTGPGGTLRPEAAPPIRIMHSYAPVHQSEPKPGAVVYDLGQNFAGWPAITVRGEAGAVVKLIPGELLNKDGTVSQRSSGTPQWFAYTLKGAGVEHWHPRFSYYGFRYLQVEIEGNAHLLGVEGQAVHSSSPVAGSFASSDELLNRIHTLILRAIENNAESLLTDCPHREKLGWLEQDHLLAPSMLYDFNFSGMYAALAQNLADAQTTSGPSSGRLPEIAPQYVLFGNKWGPFDDSPEWGSVAVLAPWYVYQRNGNLAALLAQRDVMRRYVDYLGTRAHDGIVDYGLGDWYDIGPGNPGMSKLTTAGVTATAIYYQDLRVLAQVLALAGDNDASQQYSNVADNVRTTFNAKFFDAAHHRYDKGSQTAQAMPLVVGLAPEPDRDAVLETLVADIHAHNDHVTAGDIGYHYLVDALLDAGRSDVLYQMLQRTDAPSYGYQLAQGATALTEAWDANPASSQDHFMLGHAEEWFYRGLAGINVDLAAAPGQRLLIAPKTLAAIGSVQCTYQSAWGEIQSNWSHHAGVTSYDITIPVNATATVRIESADTARITVSGLQPARVPGVQSITSTNDALTLLLGSGHYRIVAPSAAPPQIANVQHQ